MRQPGGGVCRLRTRIACCIFPGNWKGPKKETLDGTNNATERAIGWWIKERYRCMRGYKVPANAVGGSRLLAWCGNFLSREQGANLAGLLQ